LFAKGETDRKGNYIKHGTALYFKEVNNVGYTTSATPRWIIKIYLYKYWKSTQRKHAELEEVYCFPKELSPENKEFIELWLMLPVNILIKNLGSMKCTSFNIINNQYKK
jgi:hypothetical protein